MKNIGPKSLITGVLALVLMATSCKESPEAAYIGIWEEAGKKQIRFELQKKSRANVWVDGKLKTTSIWSVKGGKIEVVLPFVPQEETWIFEEKRPGVLRHIAVRIKGTTTPLLPPRMILERKAK